jgi:hypothetical protein
MKHHSDIETRRQKLLSLIKEAKETLRVAFSNEPAGRKNGKGLIPVSTINEKLWSVSDGENVFDDLV